MLTLRPITPVDRPMLWQIYASTRAEELAQTDWSAEQKSNFIEQQFTAQHSYYTQHYNSARFCVIELNGQVIGRLYVDEWAGEIRIVDLALLPEFRNHGYGTQLLKTILAEGHAKHKPVSIHVEQFNPAQNLYARLGFKPMDTHGVYLLLRTSLS
ncbi:MAG: GNAT family N-acetyltransferase [Anaerolineales bacterium]|nr:GNAT family N-acetyltransferase [Anaerolineales bacterium]